MCLLLLKRCVYRQDLGGNQSVERPEWLKAPAAAAAGAVRSAEGDNLRVVLTWSTVHRGNEDGSCGCCCWCSCLTERMLPTRVMQAVAHLSDQVKLRWIKKRAEKLAQKSWNTKENSHHSVLYECDTCYTCHSWKIWLTYIWPIMTLITALDDSGCVI